MDPFSILTGPEEKAIRIPVDPAWQDHHVRGRPVVPAVAAMAILGDYLAARFPQLCVHTLQDARFPKFLEIPSGSKRDAAFIDAVLHLSPHPADRTIKARLTTSRIVGSAGIRRSFVHAEMRFAVPSPALPCITPDQAPSDPALSDHMPPDLIPIDVAGTLTGVCTVIDPKRLYGEQVPFGPAFQSVRHLVISPDGALAKVKSPAGSALPSKTLGAGFPLDGAFHGACVWGQQYLGQVLFPIRIAKRVVFAPVHNDALYVARMIPVSAEPGTLVADIWLLDEAGKCREMALGVVMREAGLEALKPAGRTAEKQAGPVSFAMALGCDALALVEREQVARFCESALSPAEARRMAGMGEARQKSYLGGRLALKRLWRQLSGDLRTPAPAIETTVPDDPRPHLPPVDEMPVHVSLSHDRRFCVAVAHPGPVGVDVEPLSATALKSASLFMHDSEQGLVESAAQNHSLDPHGAALRIWSIKEAAAKVMNLPLEAAWETICVTAIGESESRFSAAGSPEQIARHQQVDGHLITVFG